MFYNYKVKHGAFSLLYALPSPFWPCHYNAVAQRLHLLLFNLLEPQSRFGDKLLGIRLVCPQHGTAVLKGLRNFHIPAPLFMCVTWYFPLLSDVLIRVAYLPTS